MYKLDFASGVCLCAIIIATFLISSSLWSIMNDGLLALRFQLDGTQSAGSICGTQIDRGQCSKLEHCLLVEVHVRRKKCDAK